MVPGYGEAGRGEGSEGYFVVGGTAGERVRD